MNIKEMINEVKEKTGAEKFDKKATMELGKMVTNKMNEMFEAGFTRDEIAKELGVPAEALKIAIVSK